MASMLMGLIPWLAIIAIIIVGFFIFAIYFRSKGKQLDILKVGLRSPSDIKPKIIFCGKGGVGYNADVIDIDAYGEMATIRANDKHVGNFELAPVCQKELEEDPENNLIQIKGWGNLAGNGITYLCNIDATNRVMPWDTMKKASIVNSQISLSLEKQKGKQEIFESVELANSLQEPFKETQQTKEENKSIREKLGMV